MLIHQAELYESAPEGRIRCTACSRYCLLKEGQTGFCGVRKNEGGKLDLMVYGRPLAVQIDPIEKKPILHAKQGTYIYSIGTAGCDFACQFCQNFDISQRKKIEGSLIMEPEAVVKDAIRNGCKGIAFTYNEPTIYTEYARDIGLIARDSGLFTVYVSNGYETEESVSMMEEFLDYITVDFKGNGSVDFYRRYMSVPNSDFIYKTLRVLSKSGIHAEITDLVVPRVGDSIGEAEKMIGKVRDIFGTSIPMSFLAFHPDYRMMEFPRTPVETLEQHYDLARNMGMEYVYIGNVPGNKYQNTYCAKCGAICVERNMMHTLSFNLTEDGKCKNCGNYVGIIPTEPETASSWHVRGI